jgi:putative transposase
MVDPDVRGLSISEQCELLDISRSSYYYEPVGESDENLAIMNRMDELHLKHPTWGSCKLRDKLRLEGRKVNKKRVVRLMHLMGMRTTYQSKNLSKRNQEHRIYPYLLRGVKIERPNQVWSTDITYIRLDHGWCYLAAVIDWHTRAILSWRLSNTCDRFFCIEAFEEALARFGKPDIFNTDQGSTFTAPDFIDVLKDAGVAISMDGKGRALDNVFIERFWRTLKYDEVYLKSYDGIVDAREQIGAFIVDYNNERPHSSLDGRVPMGVYQEWLDRSGEAA